MISWWSLLILLGKGFLETDLTPSDILYVKFYTGQTLPHRYARFYFLARGNPKEFDTSLQEGHN